MDKKEPTKSNFFIVPESKIWVENSVQDTSDIKAEPYTLGQIVTVNQDSKKANIKFDKNLKQAGDYNFNLLTQYLNDPSINVTDMAEVEDINEIDLLNNIRNRYFKNEIFTAVGTTLIVINPFQKLKGVFGEEVLNDYLEHFKTQELVKDPKDLKKKDPHIYSSVMNSIYHLLNLKTNQAIVISGESGSGKTETAKQAMSCITYFFGKNDIKKDPNKPSLEDQILGCNPILEAFGNAKTERNDNSSRFGKYTTIHLDVRTGIIEGAQIQTYLLEKNRVCEPAEGERSYHIFYHLLRSGDSDLLKSLYLSPDISSYKYLTASSCNSSENIDDKKLYDETLNAMEITGFTKAEIKSIWKIVAVCLHLGNLEFKDKNDFAEIESKDLLKNICELIGCDQELLILALTHNVRILEGKPIKSPIKVKDSLIYRNALAKELFNRLFNWLVMKLNHQLAPNINGEDPNKKYIGLLDIFGFECFKSNSLEQMCINFTNEKLQQLYIGDVFVAEKNEFIKEGLTEYLAEIKYKDNQPIIELMDKTGSGIFSHLDDTCIANKDDKTFYSSIVKAHLKTSSFKINKINTSVFGILHTAKDVEYNISGFVLKNMDEVKSTMSECFKNVKDTTIRNIYFGALDDIYYEVKIKGEEGVKSGSNKNKYLGAKFRMEMNKLMIELKNCECHYIRCLKPNELKRKECFVPCFTFQQIRYLGILDTIRVRKDGYPNRKKFKDFYIRFEDICWWQGKKQIYEIKDIKPEEEVEYFKNLSNKCLEILAPEVKQDQLLIGTTKIFMKQLFYSNLEKNRSLKLLHKELATRKIIKVYRGYRVRKKYFKVRKSTIYLQKWFRAKRYYILMQKKRFKTRIIQRFYKTYLKHKFYKYMRESTVKVQSFVRMHQTRMLLKKKMMAGAFINKEIRKFYFRCQIRKLENIKFVVDSIINRSWLFILKKMKFFSAIKIQANVRGFLTKIKHYTKVLKGRKKRDDFLYEKSSIIIQTRWRGYKVREFISKARAGVEKIQGYWRMEHYCKLIALMRYNSLLIQKNVRIYQTRKHIINHRLEEFFKEESGGEMKNYMDTTKNLFPNTIHINDYQDSKNLFKEDINSYFDEEFISKKQKYKGVFIQTNPYADPKIIVFSKVLDIDLLMDINEIYNTSWSHEFEKVYNQNIFNNTPLGTISLGGCHTLVLNTKGKVYSWGWNNYGQCGVPIKETFKTNIVIPSKIHRDKKGNIPSLGVINFLEAGKCINSDQNECNIGSIKQIVSGEDHSFIVDNECNAYAFGNNDKGQLGLGHCWNNDRPAIIEELKGKVKEIKTSHNLNIAITNNNEIYVWPYENIFSKEKYKPLRLYFDQKINITSISCGKNFAILLSHTGILYSFGKSNKCGELGTGDYNPRFTPEPIYTLADGDKICQIVCGFKHCLAKNHNGKVYSWGLNANGELGLGIKDQSYPTPSVVSFTNVFPQRTKIIQVAAGFRSSYFLTETRKIVCCGTTGDIVNAFLPVHFNLKIKTPEIAEESSFSVVKIMCTWNNSFSLFYANVADFKELNKKLTNKHKVNTILNSLAFKWDNELNEMPYVESIANYFNYIHNSNKIKAKLEEGKKFIKPKITKV